MVSDVRHAAGDEQRTWAPRGGGATGKWYSQRKFRLSSGNLRSRCCFPSPFTAHFSSSPAEPEIGSCRQRWGLWIDGLLRVQHSAPQDFEGTCRLKGPRSEKQVLKTPFRPANSRSSALFLVSHATLLLPLILKFQSLGLQARCGRLTVELSMKLKDGQAKGGVGFPGQPRRSLYPRCLSLPSPRGFASPPHHHHLLARLVYLHLDLAAVRKRGRGQVEEKRDFALARVLWGVRPAKCNKKHPAGLGL